MQTQEEEGDMIIMMTWAAAPRSRAVAERERSAYARRRRAVTMMVRRCKGAKQQ